MGKKKESKCEPGVDSDPASTLFSRVATLLRQHLAEKHSLQTKNKLKEAAKELKQFCLICPDSIPALRLLVECAFQLSDLEKACEYIAQAERIEPWNTEILIISESLYEYQAHRSDINATLVIQSSIPCGAVNAENLRKKAMGLFRLGCLERSYSLTKLCFCMNPRSEHALLDTVAVGSCFDPERLYQELLVLRDQPFSSAYLYLSLGSVCNVLGHYEQATGWLSEGLKLEPKDPYLLAMLLNEMAYVMARQEKSLAQCISIARSALETFPDRKANGFIRDTLGVAYLKKGDLAKAIRNLREAVSKDHTIIPRFHLSLALLLSNQPDGALSELRSIVVAKPSLESPHAEEIAILDRVQMHFAKLEKLLQNASSDDVLDALRILEGLV